MEIMGSTKKLEDVQETACFAIANLDFSQMQDRIPDTSAAVIAAMKEHKVSAGLQKYGCAALGNLAQYYETNIKNGQPKQDTSLSIGNIIGTTAMWKSSKCIKYILIGMAEHSDHRGVQQSGFQALADLAADSND